MAGLYFHLNATLLVILGIIHLVSDHFEYYRQFAKTVETIYIFLARVFYITPFEDRNEAVELPRYHPRSMIALLAWMDNHENLERRLSGKSVIQNMVISIERLNNDLKIYNGIALLPLQCNSFLNAKFSHFSGCVSRELY